MPVALIILAALVIVGTVLYIHHRHYLATHPEADESAAAEATGEETGGEECCGMHITCENDSLLAAISREIVYYDDEELDAYRGRGADEYTDAEIEQFRDVLLTLLPHDIAGWGRSIQLRGITLPWQVRDELLMIVAEARQNAAARQ